MESGGYDAEFVNTVLDQYKCAICLLVLRDPVQLRCGHRYCGICFHTAVKIRAMRCPLDNEDVELNGVFPDAAIRRSILDLSVRCNYYQDGCTWNGELRDLENHINPCSSRELQQKQNSKQQLSIQCMFRPIVCKYCTETYKFKDEKSHFEVCEKFPLECTNKCGLNNIARVKLATHIVDDCPFTEVECYYHCVGCNFKDKRCEKEKHERDMVHQHLAMSLSRIATQQNQLTTQQNQLTIQQNQLTTQQNQLTNLQNQVTTQHNELATQKNQLATQHNQMTTSQTEVKSLKEELKTQIKEIELLKTANIEINKNLELSTKLQLKTLKQEIKDVNSNIFAYTWTVVDFDRKYESDEDIHSETFYTTMGYRLRLVFIGLPNGDIYISIQVAKGKNDVALRWPFLNPYKLSLIDRNETNDDSSQIYNPTTYRDYEQRKWYGKPVNEYNDYGYGYLHISKDKLLNGKYIKDDIIIIKYEVSINNMNNPF